MYKYIFFDLDDTIWDFRSNAKESLNEAYNYFGLNNHFDDFEFFFQIYLKKNNELWKLYELGEITKDYLRVERFRYPLQTVNIEDDKLAGNLNGYFMKLLPTRTKLVPYAKELLEYLYNKYKLTIISNGFVEVQHSKLKNASIGHYFSHVVLSDDVGALKPDKRIFEHALKLNNAQPNEAIMIGDFYHADIEGAKNANIDQILFNHRDYTLKEGESCTYIVNSLEEIRNIL